MLTLGTKYSATFDMLFGNGMSVSQSLRGIWGKCKETDDAFPGLILPNVIPTAFGGAALLLLFMGQRTREWRRRRGILWTIQILGDGQARFLHLFSFSFSPPGNRRPLAALWQICRTWLSQTESGYKCKRKTGLAALPPTTILYSCFKSSRHTEMALGSGIGTCSYEYFSSDLKW